MLQVAGCDFIGGDLDNPEAHIQIESTAHLAGQAPQRITVEVDVTNTHKRKGLSLTHGGCPIGIVGLAPENASASVWQPDYACTQPLITSRIDANSTKTFTFSITVIQAILQDVTPGNYHVQVGTFFNELEHEVFSAGIVHISDEVEPVPALREIDGVRFETATRKNDEATGFLTTLHMQNLKGEPVTIRQYSDEACPFYLTGFESNDARDTYYLTHDKWNPWEQLVNKKCLINFEPITLAPNTSHTLTSFIANPRQAKINLPQFLLADLTIRMGEENTVQSFLISAGEARE